MIPTAGNTEEDSIIIVAMLADSTTNRIRITWQGQSIDTALPVPGNEG